MVTVPTSRASTSRGAQRRSPRPLRGPRWLARLWVRLLTVFVLLFATPGAAQVVHEAVAAFVGTDCCGDDCGQGDESQRCPGTCTHCAHGTCCAPGGGLRLPGGPPALAAVHDEVTFGAYGAGPYAPGFRTPPFKPPRGPVAAPA